MKEDKIAKFLVPDGGSLYASQHRSGGATPQGASSGRGLPSVYQAPPAERGELKAFSTISRGTSNVLDPQATLPPKELKSLQDVWKTGLFGRAPQVAEFPPERFKSTDANGNVCIVRYLPERFERCKVQRPELIEEFVAPDTQNDDGARLMHPAVRRRIHDLEVNGRQGEAHLRESLRQKSKLYRTCLFNFPHGALGLAESPYSEHSEAYINKTTLQREAAAAVRRSRGGVAPPTSMGDILQNK